MNITGTEAGFLIVNPRYVITNRPFAVDFYLVDNQNRAIQSKSTQVKIGSNDPGLLATEGLYINVNSPTYYTYLFSSPTNAVLTNGHGSVLLQSGASGRRNFFFHLYISSNLTIRGDSFVDVTNAPQEG